MNIIAVDDEKLALENLLTKLKEVQPNSHIKGFTQPQIALAEIKDGFRPNVAFLDIEMYGMNGVELAFHFKEVLPQINIVFVTGFSEYATDAFELHASGYMTKPIRVERIRAELENLRHPLPRKYKRIRVQTFGNFEVFVNNIPLKCQRSKTKEILAYLIDRRGAGVTMAELAAVLWENQKYDRSIQNQLQVHISDLIKTLKSVNAIEMIYKKRNFISVDVTKFDCDYYHFWNGNVEVINSFNGEYMANYSWAEFTTGRLESQKKIVSKV